MDAIGHYLSRFDALNRAVPGPGFLAHARRSAIERFARSGFPGPKDEEWRSTSVAPIAGLAFEPAGPSELPLSELERLIPRELRALPGPRLVFVSGLLEPRLSSTVALPEGLEVTTLARLLATDPARLEPFLAAEAGEGAFRALNAAFFRDGAFVRVKPGAQIDEPVQLVFLAPSGEVPVAAMPRSLVLLGEQSRATLVETYVGSDGPATLTDALTEIRLGVGASLAHYRLEREGAQAFHTGHTAVEQGRDSRYRSFSLADGGSLARHELQVRLGGEGASCALDGLSLAGGRQLLDHHTFVDHAAPRCGSEQLYKGVLDGQSRAVFQGRVLVRPGAQKTDARQANRNLLLSAAAQSNSKPQLEIFADDVKCSHGSATGQLDREALFYLRSRGLGEDEARSMLTEAFAGEVLERMELAPLREMMQASLRERILGGKKGVSP